MTDHKKSTLVAALVAASLTGGVYAYDAIIQNQDLATNRQWIDSLPRRSTDMANILIFADLGGSNRIGVDANVSEYRQYIDYASWQKKSSDTILYITLQDSKKHTMTYNAYECDHEVFELCMDVTLDGKKKTYYSFWDWEIGDVENVSEISLHTSAD